MLGPTDLAIRSGHLRGVFPAFPGSVIGFEATQVLSMPWAAPSPTCARATRSLCSCQAWVATPSTCWPTSGCTRPAEVDAETADGSTGRRRGRGSRPQPARRPAQAKKLLVLGAAGSVGTVAVQLAVARGATVVAAVRRDDFDAAQSLGAIPVQYRDRLADGVRSAVGSVDAVLDAATNSDLRTAVELAGGPERVITLTNPTAEQIGATPVRAHPRTDPPQP